MFLWDKLVKEFLNGGDADASYIFHICKYQYRIGSHSSRLQTKHRVHHKHGGVRKVYDSRPVAIPKSTIVRLVDELDKD